MPSGRPERGRRRIPVAAPVLRGTGAGVRARLPGHDLDLLDRALRRRVRAGVRRVLRASATRSRAATAPSPCTWRCWRAGVGPGDEVIVPTLTYVASANPIRLLRRDAGVRRLGARAPGTSIRRPSRPR